MSSIRENTLYVRMLQDEQSSVKYKLDNIAVEERKERDALKQTVIKYISTM